MLKFEEIQNIVNNEIAKLDFKSEPVELYQPISYVLSGNGKRLRSCLALLSCNLFNNDIRNAIKPAIGVEMFHNFTLLHDDIMDKADLRRNKPTVHKKWNENVAILSGDAMLIKAYDLFFELKPEILAKVIEVFNKAALQVCEGQQYDMNFETKIDVTTDEYIKMITLKTAVLLAASLKIGAIIGGATLKDADLLYYYGINLGIAFQLQDDYLDVYGDVKTFGKKIGGDIVSNKKTYLLISAIENAKDENKYKLLNLLYNKHIESQEKIKEVTDIYNDLNIPQVLKEKLHFYHSQAVNNISQVNAKKGDINVFIQLSNNLLIRKK
ncbi:MAG: isoprenyl synthetase [Bacteroidetes bacterium GWA2_32_17]|nr:MAG: isoprenyl synthetase [Bacteroidetes bacterium GWA2_32_17]